MGTDFFKFDYVVIGGDMGEDVKETTLFLNSKVVFSFAVKINTGAKRDCKATAETN